LKNQTSGPSVRKYLVARGREVLGTYTTRRMAIAAAVMHKGTVFSIEGTEDCLVRLAMDKTFEEAA
jgi:hypothetical protein